MKLFNRDRKADRIKSGDMIPMPPNTIYMMGPRRNGTSKIRVYKDRKGEWRWRLTSRNGKIIADSGEGYVTKRNAFLAANNFVRIVPTARIIKGE